MEVTYKARSRGAFQTLVWRMDWQTLLFRRKKVSYWHTQTMSLAHTVHEFTTAENSSKLLIILSPPTCEILILDPLDPDTTMDLKLLNSERDFWAEEPVLSLASLRILFTWFSKVWRSVLPGVGSNSSLWAFSMTSITWEDGVVKAELHHLWMSWYDTEPTRIKFASYLHFGLFNGALNLCVSFSIGDGVLDADGMTLDQKPVIYHLTSRVKMNLVQIWQKFTIV